LRSSANNTGQTVKNTDDARASALVVQTQADRTQSDISFRNAEIGMGKLFYADDENRRAALEEQFNIGTRLSGLDYNNLSEEDRRSLIIDASRQVMSGNAFGEGAQFRSLSDMVSFIEEKLNSLENSADISLERLAVERSIWEDGFVRALAFYQHTQRNQNGEMLIVADKGAAEANVNAAANFALGVMQNVRSFSNNPDIQNLIIRGMENLVDHEIRASSQANFKFMLTQRENEDNARMLRDSFRRSMEEMFESARAQMLSNAVNFPLMLNIDVRA